MKKMMIVLAIIMIFGTVNLVYADDLDCDFHTYEDDYGCSDWDYDENYSEENNYDEFRTYEDDYGCSSDWDEEETKDIWLPCDDIEPEYMVAICRANVRSGPGTCYDIVDVVNAGEDVVVIGETYDCTGKHWYKISDGSFVSAGALVTEYEYSCRKTECSEKEDSSDEESCTPSCSTVQFYKTVQVGANVRKGPGTQYPVVDGVGAGECVGIISEQDGWYYTDRGGWIAAYLFEEREESSCDDSSSRNANYGTCIVVCIQDQMVYVYRDGELIYSSSCVTGTSGQKDTPRGTFCIQDKERGKTLTDYETYSCYVEYWMPFYDGCGLHDASWRDSFGGDIYQNGGSHGCVNLPHDAAETIYNYCSEGTTVIVE